MQEILVIHLPNNRRALVKTRGFEQQTLLKFDDISIIITDKGDKGYDLDFKTNIMSNSGQIRLNEVSIEVNQINIDEIKNNRISKDDIHVLQTCSVCNGVPYCITNGCVNMGCGWLCD